MVIFTRGGGGGRGGEGGIYSWPFFPLSFLYSPAFDVSDAFLFSFLTLSSKVLRGAWIVLLSFHAIILFFIFNTNFKIISP